LPSRSRPYWGASVVAGDDFYRVMGDTDRLQLTSEEGVAHYFHWERLAVEVLQPLRAGRPASYRRYIWGENRLGNEACVDPDGAVLVEGVYVARPELVDLFDLVVLVRTEPLVSRARVESCRENPLCWVDRWERAEDWYFARAFPYYQVWYVANGHDGSQDL
jgi:uridine kinase